MIRSPLLCLFILCFTSSYSQGVHIGIFGGASAYNGDLTDQIFPEKVTNGVIGLTGAYELTDHILVRAGLAYTIIGGSDRFSDKADLRARNLSFETRLYEFSVMGEYDLFSIDQKRYTPYALAGLAIFKFDPYVFTAAKEKFYLKPLSTEGQGINGYGKNYSRTQLAIPFGGGIKYAINDNLKIGLEAHIRKLFTDYLDDVSGNYADPADLLAAKGQISVDISYRGDEVTGGNPAYPAKGAQRGSPKAKDMYYFAGLHLTYKINGDGGGGFGGRGSKRGTGCPTNVY